MYAFSCIYQGSCDSLPPPASTTTPKPTACGSPHWFNDGYCDDENNNEECGWDGKDCCGIDVDTTYCTTCACLDPQYHNPNVTSSPPSENCGSPQWFDDDFCDDDNNNEECGWDGEDCCGDNVDTTYCSVCECRDPNHGTITTSTTTTR